MQSRVRNFKIQANGQTPMTLDRLRKEMPELSLRAAMRALVIWRFEQWQSSPPALRDDAFEAFVSGIVEDTDIAAIQAEMAALDVPQGDAERALNEAEARLSYWIRRALRAERSAIAGAGLSISEPSQPTADTPPETETTVGSVEAQSRETKPLESAVVEVDFDPDSPHHDANVVDFEASQRSLRSQDSLQTDANVSQEESALAVRADELEEQLANLKEEISHIISGPSSRGDVKSRRLTVGHRKSTFSFESRSNRGIHQAR
ncbi:MAG: hypothetical protein AAF220_13985 [Pseudomonadota bacterium]